MQNKINQRDKQLGQILFSLKIMFMLFSAFPVFEQIFKEKGAAAFAQITPMVTAVLILAAAAAILAVFVFFSYEEKRKRPFLLWVEFPLFLLIYLATLWVSGLHASYYKFTFLFVIIYYTIAYSKKVGMWIAGAGSLLVLLMDLRVTLPGEVNIHFQQDLALTASFFVVAQILGLFVRNQQEYTAYLEDCATMDGLTGICNHRTFHQRLESAFEESREAEKPLSVILLDIDYFKKYNDLYGHPQGDEVLKTFAATLSGLLADGQTVARYGGEEFGVILPGLDMAAAQAAAERIRRAIGALEVPGEEALPAGKLTASLGVASRDAADDSYEAMIGRADAALYRAKYLRRDCVEIYSSAIDKYNQENGGGVCSEESLNSLKTLISIINSRDSYTYNHVERVVYYCEVFADYLHLDPEEKRKLLYAAYLHDLGKINIPKEVLIKPSTLNQQEWELFRQHASIGYNTIIKIDELRDIAPIVLQHHEKVDGSGYPERLSGDRILYLARMLSIADSFDAMTNDRPYSKKKSMDEAFAEIRRCAGTQFDAGLAEAFINALQAAS